MIILRLNKELFSLDNIKKTECVYKDFARISIISDGQFFAVKFDHCRYEEERTVKEFENYLIGLENS